MDIYKDRSLKMNFDGFVCACVHVCVSNTLAKDSKHAGSVSELKLTETTI